MSASQTESGESPAAASLAEGVDYALSASADKRVYWLSFKPDHQIARLEGEDAARFQSDYAVVVAQFPDWTVDQTLAQLWDQGGYSWLATDGG